MGDSRASAGTRCEVRQAGGGQEPGAHSAFALSGSANVPWPSPVGRVRHCPQDAKRCVDRARACRAPLRIHGGSTHPPIQGEKNFGGARGSLAIARSQPAAASSPPERRPAGTCALDTSPRILGSPPTSWTMSSRSRSTLHMDTLKVEAPPASLICPVSLGCPPPCGWKMVEESSRKAGSKDTLVMVALCANLHTVAQRGLRPRGA